MRVAPVILAVAALLTFVGADNTRAQQTPKADNPPVERPKADNDSDRVRIDAALKWLADHQHTNGYWSAKDYRASSTRSKAKQTHNLQWVHPGKSEGDTGNIENDHVAMTGLALLAFAEVGYDHKGDTPFKKAVRNGVIWLKQKQANSGVIGDAEKCSMVHDHAVATMAIAALYGVSGDTLLKPVADKAVEWILKAQNPGAGWRYGVRSGKSDTRMTGWCVLALHYAKTVNLEFDHQQPYEDTEKWLALVTVEVNGVPSTGCLNPGEPAPRAAFAKAWAANHEMDAIYILCLLYMHKLDLDNKTVKTTTALLLASTPEWNEHKVDFAYWYWGSLVFFQLSGKDRATWGDKLFEALSKNQRGWTKEDKGSTPETLDEYGSWDAVDPAWKTGGRVWSTAMATLALRQATCYRYERAQDD